MKKALIPVILLVFLGAGFLTPLSAPAAFAQTTGPEMTAYAAYDGHFKYGEWLPVWVELSNQGQDVETEVRVQVSGSQGTTVFAAPVSLPSGSRKRFPIYVLPNNFSRELEVLLVSNNKTLVSSRVAVRPQPNITYLIGIISPERGALGLVNGIELPDQNRAKVVTDVSVNDLPDRVEGLRSFDTILLNSTDTSQLTLEQANAVDNWVRLGGRLVIGGGASAAQTIAGLPDRLIPIQLNGSLEIGPESAAPLAEFASTGDILVQGPYLAAVGEPREGRILAGSEALPLVVERAAGDGLVDFVAFDLAGVPFNGWPGTQNFWEALLGPGSTYPQNLPFDVSIRQMRANQLYYALSNIPALDLPSVQGLSLLLGFYILIVGPGNYLFLRWRQRLHWAWITIPVITVLFTAGAFGIGYLMRGTDLILNQIALVEPQPGGSARVTSFLGLFSPRQQSYQIAVEGEGLVSPMSSYEQNSWGPGGGTTSGGEMVFYQGQPAVIEGLTVNQFSMQSFMSENTWSDFGGITGNLSMKGDTLVGTVRNDTPVTLTDVVVAFQNRFVRLGELAPGEETEVDLGLGNMTADRFGPPLSYQVFQENYASSGPMPRAIELKTNILSAVLDNGTPWGKQMLSSVVPSGSSGQGGNLIAFGWTDQAPPEVEVNNNRLSRQTTALVYSRLSFSLATDGRISLPVGMVPGILTQMPRDGGSCGPNNVASVHMGTGEAQFEFQAPGDVSSTQVDTLKLNLWRDTGMEFSLPQVSLWDWEADGWTDIQEPIQGINVIQNAAPYISTGGTIRVRLVSESNMYACTYLDMGLEAQGAASSGGVP